MPTPKNDPVLLRVIGTRIRTARERCGMTQELVAERVGIEPATLSRNESGVQGASISTLARISRVLGVRLGDLVDDDRPPPATSETPRIDRAVALMRGLDEHHREVAVEVLDAIARAASRRDG